MYDRKYEEKTQKSGLRVSKSCKKKLEIVIEY